MKTVEIIDKNKASLDEKGIWVGRSAEKNRSFTRDLWEEIYDYDMKKLEKDTHVFLRDKMTDHLKYILDGIDLNSKSIYLEIGCGPAFVGRKLIEDYNCTFVGVDFNYKILELLKKYFDSKGIEDFILIHADVSKIPIKDNSVDLVYGGGVIEHLENPQIVVNELYRVSKIDGVVFNTVPAFNLFWLTRFYMSIPYISVLKGVFEFIHGKIFGNRLLEGNFGYELSITKGGLGKLHSKAGFIKSDMGPFAFHANKDKLRSGFLRQMFFIISNMSLVCPFYFARAKK